MLGLAAILPVLTAGFLFVVIHYKTRLLASQAEGQRLFFMCAASGLVMSALAHAVLNWSWVPAPEWFARLFSGIPDGGHRQHVLTFLLGPAVAVIANGAYAIYYGWRVDKDSKSYASNAWEWAISAHIRKSGSPLRRMLVQAVDSNGEKLILLSMGSRKVYCGAVRRLPAQHSGDEYIEIIPMFSATRNKDTLKFEERIEYPAFHLWRLKQRIVVLQDTIADRSTTPAVRESSEAELAERQATFDSVVVTAPAGYAENLDIDLWAKVIPVKEIESLSLYDEDSNSRWFGGPESTPPPAPPPATPPPQSHPSSDPVPAGGA